MAGSSSGGDALLDIEKELTCSVGKCQISERTDGITTRTDLHRPAIPAVDVTGLSAHILWILLERMVRMAGDRSSEQQATYRPPIHVSIMSRGCARYKGGLAAHDAAGRLPESES
jgi:hypothetical protein